jgi:hypothetical protein
MLALLFLLQAATLPPAVELRRLPADEARQGAAADARFVYAISNSEIGKYDRRSGRKVSAWKGDPAEFIHMNSCTLAGSELVCAASNYPDVPMASSIEWFDTRTMRHLRSRSLGPGRGSLTWLEWHDGSWWACFANYDGKGGEAGRDHRTTVMVRYDRNFEEQAAWLFPKSVLERFAPYSASGGAWKDGFLYVTGHDRPEMYVLALPKAGSRLVHRATIPIPTPGQAIQWDKRSNTLWSLDRKAKQLVESRPPPVPPRELP